MNFRWLISIINNISIFLHTKLIPNTIYIVWYNILNKKMTISSRNTRRTFVIYNTKAPVDTYYNGRHQINVVDPIADDEV